MKGVLVAPGVDGMDQGEFMGGEEQKEESAAWGH